MSAASRTVPSPYQLGTVYDMYTPFYKAAVNTTSLHRGFYEGPEDRTRFAAAVDRLTRRVAEEFGVGTGDRVLDIGCGTGQTDLLIAKETGCCITGVNVGGGQITIARLLAETAGMAEQLLFEMTDGVRHPFADDSFDAVLFFESFVYMPDKEQALAEAMRCLKPGGTVMVVDSLEVTERVDEEWRAYMRESLMWYPSSLADLADSFNRAGIRTKSVVDLTENTADGYRRAHEEALANRDEVIRFFGKKMADTMLEGLGTLVSTLEGRMQYVLVTGTKACS